MPNTDDPTQSDHLRKIEALLADLESQRAAAMRRLATAHGTDAELLAVTLKQLDERLEGGRKDLATLQARARRTARMSELAAELKAVRVELEDLLRRGDKGARFEELRARAAALHAEGNELRSRPNQGQEG